MGQGATYAQGPHVTGMQEKISVFNVFKIFVKIFSLVLNRDLTVVFGGERRGFHSLVPALLFNQISVRAPIDRPISRESSASPDLVDDRSVHPVSDHKRSEQRHTAVVWIQLATHLSDRQIAVI